MGKDKARKLTREEETRDKRRWMRWSSAATEKGIQFSDFAGGYINAGAESKFVITAEMRLLSIYAELGAQRFWPTSGYACSPYSRCVAYIPSDMPLEIDKAERIIRAFTTEGIAVDEPFSEEGRQGRRRVFRKIAPNVMASAKGIVVSSAKRCVDQHITNQPHSTF